MSEQVFIEFHTRWFYVPAIISIAFVFAFFGIKDCYKKIRQFVQLLDNDQKKVYNEIRKERENTHWCALMQGCFVAILYIVMTTFMCGRSKPIYHLISDVVCIVFTTTYFVYILKPKKKIMLVDGGMDETQQKKWVEIYRCMQKSFWSYFLIGLLFSGFVFSLLDIISSPVRVCVRVKPEKKPRKVKNKK